MPRQEEIIAKKRNRNISLVPRTEGLGEGLGAENLYIKAGIIKDFSSTHVTKPQRRGAFPLPDRSLA